MTTVSMLNRVMSVLDRYPILPRLLRPLANAPLLSKHLQVLTRAYMGATSFEIHDVDVKIGRIGVGGVDEIMFSSKFLELFHTILASKMGEDNKNAALYEVGKGGGYFEVSEAIEKGRWAPKKLIELIEKGSSLETLRTDPEQARFFLLAMKMVMRIIINEGGWGHSEFDLSADPLKITLHNSQESDWLTPSAKPACYISAGVCAGYTSRLLGLNLDAREVECKAMGHPTCVFEIFKASD